MSTTSEKATRVVKNIIKSQEISELSNNLRQKPLQLLEDYPVIPPNGHYTADGQKKRIDLIEKHKGISIDYLKGDKQFKENHLLQGNIEHYIGMTQVPTAIIGPVLVNGSKANGYYFVPLATTEGALVASYNRGIKASRLAGGITSICLLEGVQRSPIFKFYSVVEVGNFLVWFLENLENFKKITSQNSNYAKLEDVKTNIEGCNIIFTFEFTTGDASGQNMVTICTDAICNFIIENSPIKPHTWYLECNYSGDKKATSLSFNNVRGKKVTTEVIIPKEIVKDVLKSTPEKMVDYTYSSTLGAVQSGSIGAQGHIANGLASLFIACGQDAACVSEASIGVTRMNLTEAGDLYAALTLPNLIVGTVGGGTSLPTQKECLQIMDCYGAGNAKKFAEICGALLLAGELSIIAALSDGHFAKAHRLYGRKRQSKTSAELGIKN